MRAHGCGLTGKMSGGGLHSVAWASAITLIAISVMALKGKREGKKKKSGKKKGPNRV